MSYEVSQTYTILLGPTARWLHYELKGQLNKLLSLLIPQLSPMTLKLYIDAT